MVFYMVIMSLIELSVSRMLIGQDLRRTRGPLRDIVSLLERIWSHGRVRNRVWFLVQGQNLNIEQ